MDKQIHIEQNTGTINIYNSNDDNRDKNKETISIAAIDKYSSPLKAHVEMTRWGKNMHRVSFLMENPLMGQVLQQNYLTYNEYEEARDVFHSIVSMMEEFKKEAEKELIHSAVMIPRIWKRMAVYTDDLHKPESDDLLRRFRNLETLNTSSIPAGLLFHPVNSHFPSHEGIVDTHFSGNERVVKDASGLSFYFSENEEVVKAASKQQPPILNLRKIDKHNQNKRLAYFNDFLNMWERKKFDFTKFASIMVPLKHESKSIRDIKRNAMMQIKPLFHSENRRKWILANEKKVEDAISMMGEYAVDPGMNSREIDIDKYDLFLFDADRTIWEGEVPAMAMEGPYKRKGDTVIDSKGQKLKLVDGIREILVGLRAIGRDVGLISKSEKEGVDYQDQPVIKILHAFGLLDVFNEMIVIERKIPKSAFIPSGERVIFIDDEIANLYEVAQHSDADVAKAEEFMDYPFSENGKWVEEDIEPIEVIELKEGETEEDIQEWIQGEDEIIFQIEKNVFVRARIKTEKLLEWEKPIQNTVSAAKKENVEYVECPKECGPPSGSMAVHFELEKEDGKMWIPQSRKKEYDETCKKIKEDLKSESKNWYKESKRDYIPKSEQPDKPQDGKEYELDHKKSRNKGGKDEKKNLQWMEKDKHKKKSQENGDFKDGGDKKVKQEKGKGQKSYHNYQKSCGEAKQSKDRKELGESGYSKKQKEVADARWAKEKKKK